MASISKLLKVAKEQPVGCIFSSLLSIAFIASALGGLAFVAFAVFSIPILKDTVYSNTGFHMSAESVFINLYTGSCRINLLVLENPRAYDTSDFFTSEKSDFENYFIKAKSVSAKINPLKLLVGELEISSLSLDIEEINCVRTNNSTYNLPEFITMMSKISKVPRVDGKDCLEKFFLSIRLAKYYDITNRRDAMNWKNQLDFTFERTNITDIPALFTQLEDALAEANAPFVARGIKIDKTK